MKLTKIIWPLYKKYLLRRAQIVGDELVPFINDGYSVLDFGGSIMLTTKYVLSKKKISLTGIDIVDYKKNKDKNVNFVKYTGGKLPFKDDQFDATVALFVLHHTEDPEFYLNELIRVTKKTIIICEDSFTNKFEKAITKLICWFSNFIVMDKNLKRSFKSVSEWEELIAKNNVKLIILKRFYPYIIKKIPTKNIVIVLEKQR